MNPSDSLADLEVIHERTADPQNRYLCDSVFKIELVEPGSTVYMGLVPSSRRTRAAGFKPLETVPFFATWASIRRAVVICSD